MHRVENHIGTIVRVSSVLDEVRNFQEPVDEIRETTFPFLDCDFDEEHRS